MTICSPIRLRAIILAVPLLLAGCLSLHSTREIPPVPPSGTSVVSAPIDSSVSLPAPADPETGRTQAPAAAPVALPAPLPEPTPDASVAPVFSAPEQSEAMQGVATYYANRFNGRRTASGVVYDPSKLTAAHQSLPFGTQVKVVNLANGREVVVTVNDRCRPRGFPFIDLSRAAAARLDFLAKGTAKVSIIPVVQGEP